KRAVSVTARSISPASRRLNGRTSTPIDDATDCITAMRASLLTSAIASCGAIAFWPSRSRTCSARARRYVFHRDEVAEAEAQANAPVLRCAETGSDELTVHLIDLRPVGLLIEGTAEKGLV